MSARSDHATQSSMEYGYSEAVNKEMKSIYPFMRLSTLELRNEYNLHNQNQGSFTSSLLGLLIYVIIGILYYIFSIYGSSINSTSWSLYVSIMLLTVALSPCAYMSVACQIWRQSLRSYLPFIQGCFVITGSIILSLSLLTHQLSISCPTADFFDLWYCNEQGTSRSVPEEPFLLVALFPILILCIFRECPWVSIVIAWVIAVVCMIVCITVLHAEHSILLVVTYIPLSLLLLYENQRQHILNFLYMRQAYSGAAEQKRQTRLYQEVRGWSEL